VREVSPQQIVSDFGGKGEFARRGVQSLVAAMVSDAAKESLAQWTALFRKTCGQDWPRPMARLDRLARHYGVAHDDARPALVLFALQTWYVLLLKLLASHVLAAARGRNSPVEEIAAGDVRGAVASLLQGEVFAALAATDPWAGEPFDWFARGWSRAIEHAVVEAAAHISAYDPMQITACASAGNDLLKPLYQSLFPRAVRHALGEYYTPDWLAEHVLDQVGYLGQPEARVLDPTCGSGTFLLAALRRWRQSSRHAPRAVRRESYAFNRIAYGTGADGAPPASGYPAPPPIVGFDLHPLAVASARANYLLAVADLVTGEDFVHVPVFARDALLDPWPAADAFDFIVGNPPWIAWDNLPVDYRAATKPQWQRYGLFSLSGNAARHGGGKKDLSMLMLYASADRYLRGGGQLGMVITQTLFQSKGAGDGFRRFQIGADGAPLRVLRVDDMVELRPFDDAANWTSVVFLRKGERTVFPVPYVKWKSSETGEQLPAASKTDLLAQPIDLDHLASPWIVYAKASTVLPGTATGPADYTAHLGANSGGANAVYWLEVQGKEQHGVRVRNRTAKAKRAVECVEAVIETDLLYPLVRWKDVDRWSAQPSGYLLLAQNPVTRVGIEESRMCRDYPRTLDYLRQFEAILAARAAYRRYQDRQPFYSMYNVGPYTLAASKVIWRRMDHKIRAAVVETIDDPHLGPRPVVPQETCVLIACDGSDEAHYLCALLNSSPVHDLVAAHSVTGGKGFGTPSILDYLPLRKFDPDDTRHVELAALSRRLHGSVGARLNANDLQAIDRLATISMQPPA
jgi:hypothetical protein